MNLTSEQFDALFDLMLAIARHEVAKEHNRIGALTPWMASDKTRQQRHNACDRAKSLLLELEPQSGEQDDIPSDKAD